jgi:hypothetical protein
MRIGETLLDLNQLNSLLAMHTHNDMASRRLSKLTISQLNFVPLESSGDSDAIVATINASTEGITIAGSKITINGDVTFAAGYDPTGKIDEGGAAADINANVTTISGGKITTGSVQADKMDVTELSSIVANLGTITAGSIAGVTISIGSGETKFNSDVNGNTWWGASLIGSAIAKILNTGAATFSNITITGGSLDIGGADATSAHIDATGNLWIGASAFASAPFKVSSAGALTATSATITAAITGGTIDIGGADTTSFHVDSSGNLWLGASAYAPAPFKISSAGVITVGGTGEVTITSSGGFSCATTGYFRDSTYPTTRYLKILHDSTDSVVQSIYGKLKLIPKDPSKIEFGGHVVWNQDSTWDLGENLNRPAHIYTDEINAFTGTFGINGVSAVNSRFFAKGSTTTRYLEMYHNNTNAVIGSNYGKIVLYASSNAVVPSTDRGLDLGEAGLRYDNAYIYDIQANQIASATTISIQGSAGSGFLNSRKQSANPSAAASGYVRIYVDNNNNLKFVNSNGEIAYLDLNTGGGAVHAYA